MRGKLGRVDIDMFIIAILVFLVIVVVLIFMFKPDILEYIRNLPEYKYDEDELIDITKLSPDELIRMGISCEVKIAFIGGKPTGNWLDQLLQGDIREFFIFRQESWEKTKLYVGIKDESNMELWILEGWDKKIGVIENNKLTIYKEFFNDEKVLFLISFDDLKMLDNSIFVKPRLLCKSKEEAEKEAGEISKPIAEIKNGWIYFINDKGEYEDTGLIVKDNKIYIRNFEESGVDFGSIEDGVISTSAGLGYLRYLYKIDDKSIQDISNALQSSGISRARIESALEELNGVRVEYNWIFKLKNEK